MISVRIEGLKELRKALNSVSGDLSKELTEELRNSSAVFKIRAMAREKMAASVGARSRGDAVGSIKIGATIGGVYIQGGSSRVPYFGWLEYGGTLKPVGGRRNHIGRPHVKRGRSLYPAVSAGYSDLRIAADRVVDNVSRKAGLI